MKRRNTFRAALALLLILTLCMPAAASGFNGKLIAITFDDGPGAYTAQLLDELAARDVKATFFVSGYRAGRGFHFPSSWLPESRGYRRT